MVKNKLLVRIFSSGMQAVAVQLLGSVFFYFISIYLSKDSFGIISWMNAVCLLLTTLLGFGLEQVVIRRIAASNRSDWAATAFFVHAVAGFLAVLLLLLILSNIFKDKEIYRLLPWFFTAQGLIYIGTPLKQFLNAKERFTPYGIIAVISNIGKIAAAYLLLQSRLLSIKTVMIILICTSAFELLCLLIYVLKKTDFGFKVRFKAYTKLIKESSAQYISVIFDMSLSRMDWILLGVMTSNVVLADYSFAYRAFELARLPIFIIAPVILPRLSRLMSLNNKPDEKQQGHINSFITVEMFFAVLIPLALNILWVPVITLITKGKYGDANAMQFGVLSLCIPLLLFINLLWSLSFGAKKYKAVTGITIICAVTNIALNLILIPMIGGEGAAIAFFVTTVLQAGLYYKLANKQILIVKLRPAIVFIVLGAVIYLIILHINVPFMVQFFLAITAYLLLAVLSKQITRQQLYNFKHLLTK